MMFQPRLSLILGKGGKYTLIVRTTVPDGCYYSGTITSGVFGGGMGMPEVAYFTAVIEKRDGVCTQALRDIVHIVQDVDLNGKKGVSVTTSFNNHAFGNGYVGAGHVTANLATADTGKGYLVPDEIGATVIGGIVGNYSLIVSASAIVPTMNYSADLKKASPQGINPSILLLDMVLTVPNKPAGDLMTKVVGHYSDPNYKGSHSDVTVRLGNQHVTVPIIAIYSFSGKNLLGDKYSLMKQLASPEGPLGLNLSGPILSPQENANNACRHITQAQLIAWSVRQA